MLGGSSGETVLVVLAGAGLAAATPPPAAVAASPARVVVVTVVVVGVLVGVGGLALVRRCRRRRRRRRRSARPGRGHARGGPAGGAWPWAGRPGPRRSRVGVVVLAVVVIGRQSVRGGGLRLVELRPVAAPRRAASSRPARAVCGAGLSRISRDSGSSSAAGSAAAARAVFSFSAAGCVGRRRARRAPGAPGRPPRGPRGVRAARPAVEFGQRVDDPLAGGAQHPGQRVHPQPFGRRASVAPPEESAAG